MPKIKHLLFLLLMIGALAFVCIACGKSKDKLAKIADLEYTVLPETEWPKIVAEEIAKRKENPFKMTYNDGTYLYICKGYGQQKTGGYSISVSDLYLTDNAIYFNSTLDGPSPDSAAAEGASYPVIVVKTQNQDKTVVFE